MTDSVTIPAYPGFWFHVVPDNNYKSPFVVLSFPVIAWRVKGRNDDCEPVLPVGIPGLLFDTALEYPNGLCIDDGGIGYSKFADWRTASKANFDESCAEVTEMELSEGAH